MGSPLLAEMMRRGVQLFDEGHFFEAHEAWEAHWLVETDETRRLVLQGLIQIAAAFHKLFDKQAPEPAASLFAKGLAKLDACPERLEGVNIGAFREQGRRYASGATEGGLDRANVPQLG